MEFLRPSIAVPIVGLPVLLVSACWMASFGEASKVSPFPHSVHVDDQGMDCTLCHAGAQTEAAAGMPSMDACTLCHEFLDEEKPEAQRLVSIYPGVTAEIPRRDPALSSEILFAHATHVAAGVDCAQCHGAVDAMDTRAQFVGMDTCVDCHSRQGRDDSCSVCHREITEQRAPRTHDLGWTVSHGSTVLARDLSLENRCSMCHGESSCNQCHRENAPRDHTQFWRREGHGIALDLDRERCRTCHTPSQCQSCHEVAEPRSHRGGFGAPRAGHCASCHFPLVDEGCVTCHRGAPSHDLAAPLPANHHPGFDCRQCHGLTAPLPHLDGGVACVLCHR